MVTVTLDTLANNGILFIRDVLRNNLTDTQSPPRAGSEWIFKSFLVGEEFDFPHVIVKGDVESQNKVTLRENRMATFSIEVEVWTKKIEDRDNLADEVVKILSDQSSADAGGTTLADNKIRLISSEKREDDTYIERVGLIRLKRVLLNFQYFGD